MLFCVHALILLNVYYIRKSVVLQYLLFIFIIPHLLLQKKSVLNFLCDFPPSPLLVFYFLQLYCFCFCCFFFVFLDEDEVGDRITVRSDEELKAMLSYVST